MTSCDPILLHIEPSRIGWKNRSQEPASNSSRLLQEPALAEHTLAWKQHGCFEWTVRVWEQVNRGRALAALVRSPSCSWPDPQYPRSRMHGPSSEISPPGALRHHATELAQEEAWAEHMQGLERYARFKRSVLQTTLGLLCCGAVAAYQLGGTEASRPFLAGGFAGLAYQILLQLSVDAVPGGALPAKQVQPLLSLHQPMCKTNFTARAGMCS